MPITIPLPRFFDRETMYAVIEVAIDEQRTPLDAHVTFDFGGLRFIDPDGVTALCNLVNLLRSREVMIAFQRYEEMGPAIRYLDDCGIFEMYVGAPLRAERTNRFRTMAYKVVPPEESHAYLDNTVSPWLQRAMGIPQAAFAELTSSVRELFTNIQDHSTENIGGMHIQYFENRNIVSVSISDFGIGIPAAIRSGFEFEKDCDAIRHAMTEGVSTREPPRHGGAGMANVVSSVAALYGGRVAIYSGSGQVECFMGAEGLTYQVRDAAGTYPGTLVALELNTDRIRELDEPEREDLEWP